MLAGATAGLPAVAVVVIGPMPPFVPALPNDVPAETGLFVTAVVGIDGGNGFAPGEPVPPELLELPEHAVAMKAQLSHRLFVRNPTFLMVPPNPVST
jgi:hypothetical protein